MSSNRNNGKANTIQTDRKVVNNTTQTAPISPAFFLSTKDTAQYAAKPDLHERITKETKNRLNQLIKSWYSGATDRSEIERRLHISQTIRNARTKKQISTESLAHKTGLDILVLALLESGLASTDEIEEAQDKLTKELEIDVLDLLMKNSA